MSHAELGRKTTARQSCSSLLYRRVDAAGNCKKLNVSRPVISKLLQKAKDVGIVEVYIKDESIHTVELEKQLETTFQLTDAVVVPSVGTMSEMVKRAVGQAGAYYLSKT